MTEVNLESFFCTLEASAYDLNQASVSANEALRDAEARLVALNIGMEVWLPSPLDTTDSTGSLKPYETSEYIATLMGFARVEGRWCLAAKQVRRVQGFYEGETDCPYENEFVESPPTPLPKQPRSVRINAAAALPRFLTYLDDRVREKTSEFRHAMEQLGR